MIETFTTEPLGAFEFARRAFALLDAMHEREYFERDSFSKRLVEEIVPIAVFAKTHEAPERHLTVSYIGANSPYDAKIFVTGAIVDHGFAKAEYYVEVTSAVAEYEYLEREALAHDGFVFGGGNIRRNAGTRKVESQPVVRDVGAGVGALGVRINSAIRAKAAKIYPDPCILIVNVNADVKLRFSDWVSLIGGAGDCVRESGFVSVYLVETSKALCYEVST